MKSVVEEYWKHTALNLGQAARDVRYFYYHPEADRIATEGSPKHVAFSFIKRVGSLSNNLFYSIIPPHLHHTREQLGCMTQASTKAWFLHGYAPWKFQNPLDTF